MKGKCKTCQYWIVPGNAIHKEYRAKNLCTPIDMDTFEEMKMPHEVKMCRSPNLIWFERPEIDQAAIIDGSEYYAELLTGEEFCCTNYARANGA